VHFYSTFWRFKCSNRHSATHLGRPVPGRGVARCARTGVSAALTSESGPTSRRPEATPPEGGSTPRVPEVRAPPRGVPAFAAPALGVVQRSAAGLPAHASRGCAVQRVKERCSCGSKHARVSTIKGMPPASQPHCTSPSPHCFVPRRRPPWGLLGEWRLPLHSVAVQLPYASLGPRGSLPRRALPDFAPFSPEFSAATVSSTGLRRAAPPGSQTPPPTHQNEP
jgi:hypothetical protein